MSSSGPPELPGLRAASVWIVPVIAKPLGESIWRRRPETIPVDSEPCRPKGLPMATTGSPTRGSSGREAEGRHVAGGAVELQHRDVHRALDAARVRAHAPPADGHLDARRASPTTWALVTT